MELWRGPNSAAHEGTLGDSAVRPRLQPGSINWALKREKCLTVTKSEGHKKTWLMLIPRSSRRRPLHPQLQAPVETGTRLQGLSLGGTESKIIPDNESTRGGPECWFPALLLATEAEVPREASGGRGCRAKNMGSQLPELGSPWGQLCEHGLLEY